MRAGDLELLFWHAEDGAQASGKDLRDATWATWTCVLGFPVKGIWDKGMDGTDINDVCRSGGDMRISAVGDDKGRVRIFRYPAVDGAGSIVAKGHSSHVTRVRFTADSKRLLSLGGKDQTVLQWTVAPK